jgi:hypothetical protein
LKDVKKQIAEYLAVDEKTFIMKRFSHNGQELKNLSDKLDSICVTGSVSIYVEYGTPLAEG